MFSKKETNFLVSRLKELKDSHDFELNQLMTKSEFIILNNILKKLNN